MRILITGGAGCLGSNLIEHWLPHGHEVFVIDNFSTSKREVLPDVEGLRVKEGDIAEPELVDQCFREFHPDVVINSAASYKDPEAWVEDTRTNIIGSINVARMASKYKVRRLINFQTVLCYGKPISLPISNRHPTAPFTSYGITKTAGEQFMMLSGVSTLSLRIANVTGPRLAIGPIPTFYKRLKSGQNCFCSETSRDFLDMSDFLSFMDIAIEDHAPVGIFNVSTGEAHTIKEIFDLVVDHLGLEPREVPTVPVGSDDVSDVSLDPTETTINFGWRAKKTFTETIINQLLWYDNYGVSDVFSHLKQK